MAKRRKKAKRKKSKRVKGTARSRKKKAKPAEKKDPVKRPRNWDKAVSVAYLRMLGASQEVSSKEAGCAQRSVVDWERCSWWKDAQAEARDRWMQGGDSLAMRAIYKGLANPDDSAQMSRWWADRRIPELAPPRVRGELDINAGRVDVVITHADNKRDGNSSDD